MPPSSSSSTSSLPPPRGCVGVSLTPQRTLVSINSTNEGAMVVLGTTIGWYRLVCSQFKGCVGSGFGNKGAFGLTAAPLGLCHRLIACSIAGRSQAPEKVTLTDLRKSGAYISGGQFIARLTEHFGLLTVKILQGLTVISPALPVIDMAELPDSTVGALEDAHIVDEGGQAVLAPVQAP
ncbi:hypothetical protein Tco_0994656 [Tanacetum coccineum]